MHKRNIRITLMYDGSRYSGWQRLGEVTLKASVQGTLETVLSKVLKEPINVIGSGRTDQGVHAYAAVANFHTDKDIDTHDIMLKMNVELPKDIQITMVEEVTEPFHSRYNAKYKVYEYRIDNRDKACVFTRDYTYHHKGNLNINKMQQAANHLVGKHDFKAFSSPMRDNRTTIREIFLIEVKETTCSRFLMFKNQNEIIITVRGNGFLYNMVRIIIGTLIEVGEGIRKPEDVKRILESMDRSLAGPTAQYQGLFLKEVEY